MSVTVKVLHITAHLGGGIGKALSGLVLNTPPDSGVSHSIVCLESPHKKQFLEQLIDSGCFVSIAPDHAVLAGLIERSDIVQLEWWGHPVTIATLCGGSLPPMRLLVWCHVSGIHTPTIPAPLIKAAQCCIFTSPCSYEAAEVMQLLPSHRDRMDVIYSAGGFNGLIAPDRRNNDSLVAGYLGSLNFAKLHPRYIEYLSAVTIPDFTVRMIGDIANRDILEQQCLEAGRPGLLDFRGYATDVYTELAAINVLPYILNPQHYGTTENALLESMVMGVVPVVLDNPAERCLVKDGVTGLIIRTPQEFGDAVAWLANNPMSRRDIVRRMVSSVRDQFAVCKMTEAFNRHYTSVNAMDKKIISFDTIFGKNPYEWFLASQRRRDLFTSDEDLGEIDELTLPGLMEKSKGSVFHYLSCFPEEPQLHDWANKLTNYKLNKGM